MSCRYGMDVSYDDGGSVSLRMIDGEDYFNLVWSAGEITAYGSIKLNKNNTKKFLKAIREWRNLINQFTLDNL